MKTKALITIEVEIDTTHIPVQEGLGDISKEGMPQKRGIEQAKRDFIWDYAYGWLSDKQEFVQIKQVKFPKANEAMEES